MDEARMSISPSGLDGGRDKCCAYYAVKFGPESEERVRQFGAGQCKRIVKQPEFVLNTTPHREGPENCDTAKIFVPGRSEESRLAISIVVSV
jgi:hypothetical protein